VKNIVKSIIKVFLFVNLLSVSAAEGLTTLRQKPDVYIAGYVHDDKGKGVEGATVIISSEQNKVSTLRTGQAGWFETSSPLSRSLHGRKLFITVFRRGYGVASKTIVNLDEKNKPFTIDLGKITDPDYRTVYIQSPYNVLYGRVSDKKSDIKIKGAIITLKKGNELLGGAVTRDSGYFSLYYPKTISGPISYQVVHERFNTENQDDYQLSSEVAPLEIPLGQTWRRWSVGAGFQLQLSDDQKDNETNAFLSLNFTRFNKKILVRDDNVPVTDSMKGTCLFGLMTACGYDLSIAYIPVVEIEQQTGQAAKKETTHLITFGFGLAWYDKSNLNSDYLYRAGVSYSTDSNYAIYFGIGIPISYF